MPARNALPYLKECIDSILAQHYVHWELIVVNDHSTDQSQKVLEEYSLKDKRIKVFTNEGQGIISALNLAYQYAEGLYITRMDADDLMAENKLGLMLEALQQNGKGFLSTTYVEYFAAGELGEGYQKYATWLNELCANANNFKDIYKECVIPSPSWMMHREDFEKIGAFRSDVYPEDYELCFRMYAQQLKIAPVKQVCHYWRDHGTRASRNDEHYADNNFLALKIDRFLALDYKPSANLILWGAGRKGKWLAQYLSAQKLDFNWICDNPKKVGKHIYGIKMQAITEVIFDDTSQVIVAVANEESQAEINAILGETESYFFA